MFIAKLIGAVYLALGLGLLISTKYYKKAFPDMLENTSFLFILSVFAILIGLVLILTHNIWEWSWVVIITIIGWTGLVKGAVFMIFPKAGDYFKPWFKNGSFLIVVGIGALIFGGVLTYFGWFL